MLTTGSTECEFAVCIAVDVYLLADLYFVVVFLHSMNRWWTGSTYIQAHAICCSYGVERNLSRFIRITVINSHNDNIQYNTGTKVQWPLQ